MSNVAFLLLAVGLSVVGSVVLWWKTKKPTTVGSSIDSFHREMKALAPERDITGATLTPEPPPGFRTLGDAEIAVQPADPSPWSDAAAGDAPSPRGAPRTGRHDGGEG